MPCENLWLAARPFGSYSQFSFVEACSASKWVVLSAAIRVGCANQKSKSDFAGKRPERQAARRALDGGQQSEMEINANME
jgi:hypothetical protein